MLTVYNCIAQAHDLRLVGLAAVICLLASFTAITERHSSSLVLVKKAPEGTPALLMRIVMGPNAPSAPATAFATDARLVEGTLVQLDSKLNIVPGLATSWKFTDNSQTLTFNLRPKVKFQNGAPFTSADVADSLNRILNPATAAVARSNIADIQSISTPGPLTVVLHLADPDYEDCEPPLSLPQHVEAIGASFVKEWWAEPAPVRRSLVFWWKSGAGRCGRV